MDSQAVQRMRARARAVRTRAHVRAWKYRQRNLAAGVWFRLRRVLADAKAAYVISDEDARRLLADGYELVITRLPRRVSHRPEESAKLAEETLDSPTRRAAGSIPPPVRA